MFQLDAISWAGEDGYEAAYTFGFKESNRSKDRIPNERVYVQRRKKAVLAIKTAMAAKGDYKE